MAYDLRPSAEQVSELGKFTGRRVDVVSSHYRRGNVVESNVLNGVDQSGVDVGDWIPFMGHWQGIKRITVDGKVVYEAAFPTQENGMYLPPFLHETAAGDYHDRIKSLVRKGRLFSAYLASMEAQKHNLGSEKDAAATRDMCRRRLGMNSEATE